MERQLRAACRDGNLQRVEELHGQGVSLTTTDNDGRQPIHFAAWKGHLDVAQWLHGQGVDVAVALTGGPRAGDTPAALARLCRHDDVANWLAAANRSTASDEVTVTGERTFAQRDAESRKRAIDLEAETPRKRGRAATSEMEERVATARSICTAEVDKRASELARAAFDEYMADKIDATELDKRKAAARAKAAAEHKPLATLDGAFKAYTEAVAAREAAQQAYTKAEEAEDAAEAKLTAALREHEKGQAGPSGAVKAG
jgi:hypothetical protein